MNPGQIDWKGAADALRAARYIGAERALTSVGSQELSTPYDKGIDLLRDRGLPLDHFEAGLLRALENKREGYLKALVAHVQQSTPFDEKIAMYHAAGQNLPDGLLHKRKGYLAAVADHADLVAVLASVENVIKECEKPGDVWTGKRLTVGLGPQVRAALAKHRGE